MKVLKIIVDKLPEDCLLGCPLKSDRAGCGKFIDDNLQGGYGAVCPISDVSVRWKKAMKNKYMIYEQEKERLRQLNLSPEKYEKRVRELMKKLKL